MGLITQDNGCVLCFLDFSKLKLDVKGRLIISESSGYHCTQKKIRETNNFFEKIFCFRSRLENALFYFKTS